MSTKSKLINNNQTIDNSNKNLLAIKNAFLKPLPQYNGDTPSSGIDTSNATATPDDILSGKTAYARGLEIVGTHVCSNPETEEKTATPTTSTQEITPSTNKYLSKVTINPIPSDYLIPIGSLDITENGTHDVSNYASVNVNVSGGIDGIALNNNSGEFTSGDNYLEITTYMTDTDNLFISGGINDILVSTSSKIKIGAFCTVELIDGSPQNSITAENLLAENIKKGVNILGYTGTYEGNISSGSTPSETVTLNTDNGDVVVTAPPKEARNQAWFILTVPGQSKFFLYVTPFGWGRYNSKYYVIKQNGTELEGSADYPYLVYEMSTSTPLGTWTYSGSGYASTQAYNYWAECSNTDIYNWSNLAEKGSTIHFAKNTD